VGDGKAVGRQAHVTAYLTIALCLFPDDDYEEVATKVTGALSRFGCWGAAWSVPTASGITQARKRQATSFGELMLAREPQLPEDQGKETAVSGAAAAVLLNTIALTAFRRDDAWDRRALDRAIAVAGVGCGTPNVPRFGGPSIEEERHVGYGSHLRPGQRAPHEIHQL
jgi:hypothetical protein